MQKDNKNFPILLFFSLRLEYDEKKSKVGLFKGSKSCKRGEIIEHILNITEEGFS